MDGGTPAGAVPLVAGLVLGALTAVAANALPTDQALELLAAILVAAGAVYIGAALADGRRPVVLLEACVGVAFGLTALLGLWYSSTLLGAGYVAHGAWDYLHHPHRLGARAGGAFPPACLMYDLLVGIFIFTAYS